MDIFSTLNNLLHQTAFFNLTGGNLLMILVAFVFLYLAIRHGFEPLLLIPISFGMLLVNIYPNTGGYGYGVPVAIAISIIVVALALLLISNRKTKKEKENNEKN